MKNTILLFVLFSSLCVSQDTLNFPFSTENKWVYNVYSAFSGFPINRVSYQLGKDTLLPNNKTYKPYAMFFLRKVGPKIYQFSRNDSSEFVRYDFSKKKNDTVSFIRHGKDSSVIVLADDRSTAALGQLRRVLSFHSKDGTVWDDVADSIGIMYFSNVIDIWYELSGAIISGKVYGDITSVADKINLTPHQPNLLQNYPNPFNPSTTIRYELPSATKVKIIVSNQLGQQIAVLLNSNEQAGSHQIEWNAANFPSGIYFCTMSSDKFVRTAKLILLK